MGDLTRNFSRAEMRCPCCDLATIDWETLNALQELRNYYNQVITITSAARCKSHNQAVGGAKDSMHLQCRAVDFTIAGVRPQEVQAYLSIKYPGKFGIGRYSTFTHMDSRETPARWEG